MTAGPPTAARRVGRPARIDREKIADAVLELGLEGLTMKAVAEQLGVSVPGLYHHVKGRDDLLRLAAEHRMAQVEIPVDRGQHWADWLREWARYSRASIAAQPELLNQLLNGAMSADRIVTNVNAVLDGLTRQGFTVHDALRAWEAVSYCAIGAVFSELREREAARQGRPRMAEFHRVLATHAPGELTSIRALAHQARPADPEAEFEDQLTTVLAGIAVRRGEAWDDGAAGSPGPGRRRLRAKRA